jgi:hypothetical protein
MRRAGLAALAATGAVVIGFGTAAPAQDATLPAWRTLVTVKEPEDVVGQRRDGRFVVTTHIGLFLMDRDGRLTPFARGEGGYPAHGGEPYIAMSRKRRLRRAGCSFRRDDVFALEGTDPPGLTRINRRGRASRFADFPAGASLSGIAFDHVGTFGSRLLVTGRFPDGLSLYAVDCRGRVRTLARKAPIVEGGIEVAPRSFGRFGGQLIAADEGSGRIIAFDRRGESRVLADPGLPAGGDIGLESVGFVPRRFDRRTRAFMADPGSQPAPTVGTDSILTLSGRSLLRVGVRAGDLLVAREATAETIRVRCDRTRCTTKVVATGPAQAHAEGHITFALAP